MKHLRALQEQASTYLDLVCSVCDLSDETVRETAAEIQQTKTMVTAKPFQIILNVIFLVSFIDQKIKVYDQCLELS